MPCRYVIDKQRQLVLSSAWDRVTFAEIKAHQDQLMNDPDFDPAFNQLVDATRVTVLDATVKDTKRIAGRAIFSSASRRAFVATNPDVFDMGRVLGTYLEMAHVPRQVNVFYDRKLALQWLGLEDPQLGGEVDARFGGYEASAFRRIVPNLEILTASR